MLLLTIILLIGFILLAFVCLWIVLKNINERNAERDRFKKAIDFAYAEKSQAIESMGREYSIGVKKLQDRISNERAIGVNEGKRDVLAWIRNNVEAGSLEIRFIGSPVNAGAPAPFQSSALENQTIEQMMQQ